MVDFFKKQISASIFGLFLLTIIILTKYYNPLASHLHRYDFIFIMAVIFQCLLIVLKYETKNETVVIIVFHILAVIMELFKTSDNVRSWYYPEEYLLGINNVPLFTGFMYSAVGSYLARSWKIFDIKFNNYPKLEFTIVLVTLIYINFFTQHYLYDIRLFLLIVSFGLFYNTRVHITIAHKQIEVPLLLIWILIAILIWLAENIATFAGIWLYPNQMKEWEMVGVSKLSSWYLLMILSFVLISLIKLAEHLNIVDNFIRFITVSYLTLIPIIIIDANVGHGNISFEFLKYIPGKDYTGHIFLFCGFTIALNYLLKCKRDSLLYWHSLLRADIIVFCFLLIEEVSQLWISTRVFEIADIISGTLGILLAHQIINTFICKRST